MTYDDDHVVLRFDGGTKRFLCKQLGLTWPPPERIEVLGIPMKRNSFSSISDEQRGQMTHVCRGAEYLVEKT